MEVDKMGNFFLGILATLIVVGLIFMVNRNNPYEDEIASILEQSAQIDRQIANARTQSDCEALAGLYLGRRMIDALNQRELVPDFTRLLEQYGVGRKKEVGDWFQQVSKEMRAQVAAVGQGGLHLIACLKHLDTIGAVPMEESLTNTLNHLLNQSKEEQPAPSNQPN